MLHDTVRLNLIVCMKCNTVLLFLLFNGFVRNTNVLFVAYYRFLYYMQTVVCVKVFMKVYMFGIEFNLWLLQIYTIVLAVSGYVFASIVRQEDYSKSKSYERFSDMVW